MNSKLEPAPLAGVALPPSLEALRHGTEFVGRHIGPDAAQQQVMLDSIAQASLETLVAAAVPASIALERPLALPEALNESEALAALKAMVAADRPGRSYIGLGYYATRTPAVIQRNVLENPGWYTAYTPYQAEISQGRLECLLNFQQMILDLSGMDLANASLLDEASAAAEAMALAKRVSTKPDCKTFFADEACFPQTLEVLRTRAACFGYELVVGPPAQLEGLEVFGALFQYPDRRGQILDLQPLIAGLHAQQALALVAADPLALALLTPPGELGADVVLGSTQRFGVAPGYGGPHAAYLAVREAYKRGVPGRVIGVSVDARGRRALRMAMQTREQHIRREKANSNICTAQVLLANMAALYALYHGPDGLSRIAQRVQRLTAILAAGLRAKGVAVLGEHCFDTLTLQLGEAGRAALARAREAGVHLREDEADGSVLGLSLDECAGTEDVETLWQVLLGDAAVDLSVSELDLALREGALADSLPAALRRRTPCLSHPIFSRYHSETEMLRYLKRLEDRDIALNRSMIPLGSCTMKLNAAAEMLPVTWPEFSLPHPFQPPEDLPGYRRMITELADMLTEITGYDAFSMQPNSGAQGEYAGLLAIRRYLDSQGQTQRDVCLIPRSAHGTNPATAQMVGMRVQIVDCDAEGNVDLADLQAKAEAHSERLAALMITYPSTHGVFEEQIKAICALVHAHGGQVYLDGANLNAQVGLTRPGDIGADVSHVNLHKTFCIPHGGGGPGMGPIGVKQHLAPFLPGHCLGRVGAEPSGGVSAAPFGSAGILPISWMYLRMMGPEGLRQASQVAILNANYIAQRLAGHYPVLYTGARGLVAHECIIDLRELKKTSGISEEDVAKRLIDYGFHAPTMSFPVPGTLMIEPTESESQDELDRFIDALLRIRAEIARVERGELSAQDSPLRRAPHTLDDIMDEGWDRPYSKAEAAFPAPWLREHKYWPPVNRVDNVHGDRHLFCSCPLAEDYG